MITLHRYYISPHATLGYICLRKEFLAYTLEREAPVCIDVGKYPLEINTVGKMNTKYAELFKALHQGMIEVIVSKRKYLYIHVGNFAHQSKGCVLVGNGVTKRSDGSFALLDSRGAYKCVYTRVIDYVKKGGGMIEIS